MAGLPRFSSSCSKILAATIVAALGLLSFIPKDDAAAQSATTRQKVDDLSFKAHQIRERYDELVAQINRSQNAILEKQLQIVNVSSELMRREEELTRKTADLHTFVRLAYKYGPGDIAGSVITAKSFSEIGLANRYLGSRVSAHRRAIEEMLAAQTAVTAVSMQLEDKRAQLQADIERLLDAVDDTQAALVDAETALAAARQELDIREQMQRAIRLVQAAGASGQYSQRHILASQRQSEFLAKYPFGPVSGVPSQLRPTGQVIEGVASWYGPGFHGLPTASGAVFDENLYTCANKELPLGTILLVTYQGRSVLVLVNDRGPFVPGRVLDLSKAAKEAIGMGGLGYVTAQVLEPI